MEEKCNDRIFKGITHLPIVYKIQDNGWKKVLYHENILEISLKRANLLVLVNCSANLHEIGFANIFTMFLPPHPAAR